MDAITGFVNKHYRRTFPGACVDKAPLAPAAVLGWLQEADKDPAAFPIGSTACVRWRQPYDFHEHATAAGIQKTARVAPRSDMVRLADFASYLGETGVLCQVF